MPNATEFHVYRAVAFIERALAMSYAPSYAVQQAAEHYQVPAGQLSELLLVKLIECERARCERDAMQQHDAEVEAGKQHKAVAPHLHRVASGRRRAA